jgi:hypothetical protein
MSTRPSAWRSAWVGGGLPPGGPGVPGTGGGRWRGGGQSGDAVEEGDSRSGVKAWEGLPNRAPWPGRGEVRRSGRQGAHAAVRVRHDDRDEAVYPPDGTDRQGVAVEGVHGSADGDAAPRFLEARGRLRIASRP